MSDFFHYQFQDSNNFYKIRNFWRKIKTKQVYLVRWKFIRVPDIKLFRKYNTLKKKIKNDYNEDNHENDNDENEIQSQQLPQNDINNYGNVLHIFKRITKVNGTYNIDGKIYEKLIGLRQEVMDEKAYKTAGSLLKDDLMVNRYGKVISKKKYIQEKTNNRFTKLDVWYITLLSTL